jgi:hypothetical protein
MKIYYDIIGLMESYMVINELKKSIWREALQLYIFKTYF